MFLILEAVGAKLTIGTSLKNTQKVSVLDFLNVDMRGKVLQSVTLPALSADRFQFGSYKIMPRAQNAHAFVNAGFLLETAAETRSVVRSVRICFGGIEPYFTHASATEKALIGRSLHTNETLQLALRSLQSELHADWVLPDASPEYRTQLALALFYRFVLDTTGGNKSAEVSPVLQSGCQNLVRPISSGLQDFETMPANWPLTQPVSKYEGLLQCAGEAEYVNDIALLPGELWAAFVPGTVVNATVVKVDVEEALVSLINQLMP